MEETKKTLDRLDEIAYISDMDTYELLFLNQNGRERFGVPAPGVKCYEHLQHKTSPCDFCTNAELPNCPNKQKTWEREHPTVGTMRLHDSIIDYGGKPRRMEVAFDINRFADDLSAAEGRLAAEKKLVACIEKLVVSRDFTAAVNTMLEMILGHYHADRAYVFEFDWDAHTTKNTYEVCKDGVTPQIDTLQNVPIDAVALWVDIFKHQQKQDQHHRRSGNAQRRPRPPHGIRCPVPAGHPEPDHGPCFCGRQTARFPRCRQSPRPHGRAGASDAGDLHCCQ